MKDVDFPTRLIGPRDREGLGKRTFLCTRACACASRRKPAAWVRCEPCTPRSTMSPRRGHPTLPRSRGRLKAQVP